ncbi:MAG: HAD domain-containing protein [Proteobacteria bacterium]|nr:HAD domain-containing protein [Pseudomonadota bacterium]
MLIFLDFDGVLHPMPRLSESFFCRADLFWEILRACPDVQVVFSSSWRNFHAHDELVEFVTSGGGEDLSHRFIGFTPSVKAETCLGQRDIEIKCWLEANSNYADKWIAIDDMPDLFFHEMEDIGEYPNLYVVDCKAGLTERDVTALIERLAAI